MAQDYEARSVNVVAMSQVRIFLRVKVKLDIINCSSVRHDSMGSGDLMHCLIS